MRYSAAIVLLALQATQPPVSGVQGTWTAELHSGKVFLQLRTPPPPDSDRRSDWGGDWSIGRSLSVDEVAGLPANDDRFTAANIKFDLRREAGTLSFEGAFRDGRGAGLLEFRPRPEYAAEMKRLGYVDDLPLWRRFQLAVHDVGPRYINALKSEGYENLPLDTVRRASSHGVTIEYIRTMKAEGYRGATLEELVRTHDHGVTVEYIREMRKAGFGDTPIESLVRVKDHGVTPAFVQEIRALGLGVSSLDQFVRVRDHGVTPAYVREMAAQGYKNVPVEELVRARDHGVSAEYAADMKAVVKDPTLAQLVRMRDHGVTPGFVNHARARGFNTTDPDELVRLKNGGLWRR